MGTSKIVFKFWIEWIIFLFDLKWFAFSVKKTNFHNSLGDRPTEKKIGLLYTSEKNIINKQYVSLGLNRSLFLHFFRKT